MYRFLVVLLTAAVAQAADVKVSDLPLKTSVSTNTFILVSDMNEVTKSGKYLITNLVTQAGLTKTAVGLGNVDNTSDANKPVSTATQAALDLKQDADGDLTDLSDGSLTGTKVGFADTDNLFTAANVDAALSELNDSINAGVPNGAGAKVHWSELLGVPAGFADNTDDGGGGGAITNTVIGPGMAVTAGDLTKWANTTGTNLTSAVANTDYEPALSTSASLATTITDETGTGAAVFADTPTFATKILIPSGTVGAPSVAFSADATTGLFRLSSSVGIAVAGANNAWFGASQWNCYPSTIHLGAAGTGTFLNNDGSSTLQVGADAATATAQTLKAHDGTGTDKDGAKLTLAGGKSTGTGRGGDLIGQTSLTGTTGSSANSYSTRQYHSAKFVDLTESTATTFANVALAASKVLGAALVCTVYASDGTDFQVLTSTVNVNAVNKAGTVTATITQADATTAASAGTLTSAYTAVANGNGVDIKANAVSSLTQTTLRVKWSIISLNSDDVGTVTPQ